MPKAPKVSLRVAVVIEDPYGQAILLQKRKVGGVWGLISGAVEDGEGFLDAAYRETREELGSMRVAIRGLFRILIEISEERIWVGVVFLGIFLPSLDDERSQAANWGFRTDDLTDPDCDELRFFSRNFVSGLVEQPEYLFLPERNAPTLRLWVEGYRLSIVPRDVWWQAFIDPLLINEREEK